MIITRSHPCVGSSHLANYKADYHRISCVFFLPVLLSYGAIKGDGDNLIVRKTLRDTGA